MRSVHGIDSIQWMLKICNRIILWLVEKIRRSRSSTLTLHWGRRTLARSGTSKNFSMEVLLPIQRVTWMFALPQVSFLLWIHGLCVSLFRRKFESRFLLSLFCVEKIWSCAPCREVHGLPHLENAWKIKFVSKEAISCHSVASRLDILSVTVLHCFKQLMQFDWRPLICRPPPALSNPEVVETATKQMGEKDHESIEMPRKVVLTSLPKVVCPSAKYDLCGFVTWSVQMWKTSYYLRFVIWLILSAQAVEDTTSLGAETATTLKGQVCQATLCYPCPLFQNVPCIETTVG